MNTLALTRTVREQRSRCRALFFLYAAALLVATHWPKLQVPGAQAGSDKLAHFLAYALWTSLAFTAGFFAPAFSKTGLRRTAALALAYSLLDETSQLIPALKRQPGWPDAAANAAGVAVAYALATMVIRPKTKEPAHPA